MVRDVSGRPYLRQKLAEAYVWFFGGKFGSELFKGLGRIHWPRRKDKSLLARAAALALFAVPRLQRRGLPPVRNLYGAIRRFDGLAITRVGGLKARSVQ